MAPSRSAALASPYYETFAKHKQEVLLLFNAVDDFVMGNVKSFGGRSLVSAETSSVDLDSRFNSNKDKENATEEKKGDGSESEESKSKADDKKTESSSGLSEAQTKDLCAWFKLNLGDIRVREVP